MKKENSQNKAGVLTITILSNHKILSESLTSWLYHRYPELDYNTSSKCATNLSFLTIVNHILIIDIGLSFLEDLDLISYIRKRFPEIKIVALTPFKKFVIQEKLQEAGICSIIPKTDITSKLAELIDQLVGVQYAL